ncbi:hypothetical protein [Enterobacter ludwigii]|uniref:hypothetical protein n=1 Tax=Enterobacter ludwigii TaxID=299767 RepID=UPI001DBF8DE5|nr:hypothetical protein [Enterobacter hormaechei]
MYLATTDTATAKASPRVFAARREKTKQGFNMQMLLLFLKLAHPVAVIIMTLLGYWKDR